MARFQVAMLASVCLHLMVILAFSPFELSPLGPPKARQTPTLHARLAPLALSTPVARRPATPPYFQPEPIAKPEQKPEPRSEPKAEPIAAPTAETITEPIAESKPASGVAPVSGQGAQPPRFINEPHLAALEQLPVITTGSVLFRLRISTLGTVDEVVVVRNDPMPPELLDGLLENLRNTALTPAMKDGRPVPSELEIVVNFEPVRIDGLQ